jgi:hypothetical protein
VYKKTSSSSQTKTRGTSGISYVMFSNNDTIEFIIVEKNHQSDMDGTLIFSERWTLIILYMELL